ncbi:MAG: type 4a pilus biogenesis protein PilO [Gammaproteobacteria bacterium]|jgi:type IV pilus assembly protein PilO|nr:type 4a pilus biogenesis protein PilO [Gammaproteobacteria bacterium]MBT3722734.1 type 4a pilus biogenesis protein PilO [Gammaproteobacteria bacterium]MBT4077692.1 type 4a pilus biogenesis protein PilO [Gammaproteobacteria bacterium]MBT4196144.1 type 4a pilus biogenesis protein PilO [Gammaproteobacteria bacterium]MBT4448632.1 type 4a pilus biogenesis protein PilO [Gammaproteobacteria bacterium]
MSIQDELNNLDFNNIGNASAPIRIGFLAITFVAIIAAGIYFDTQNQLTQLETVERSESELKTEFTIKADKAAKLELYKDQLAEMKASFQAILRQLPEGTDVESLLVDVSQTGLANGLEIKKFKPSSEEKKGFYAELPIALEVSGHYHDLASFISGVAALPRIVTMHNLKLELQPKSSKSTKPSSKLNMSATAKTYRYLKEDEQ